MIRFLAALGLLLFVLPCHARAQPADWITFMQALGATNCWAMDTTADDECGTIPNNGTPIGSGTFGVPMLLTVKGYHPVGPGSYVSVTQAMNAATGWTSIVTYQQNGTTPVALQIENNVVIDPNAPYFILNDAACGVGHAGYLWPSHHVCSTSATLNDGFPHMLAVNCNQSASCNFYVDGDWDNTTANTFTAYPTLLEYAFGNYPPSALIVTGAVGGFAYWNTALDGQQITDIWNCEKFDVCVITPKAVCNHPFAGTVQAFCETWANFTTGSYLGGCGQPSPTSETCDLVPAVNFNSNVNYYTGSIGGINGALSVTVTGGAITALPISNAGSGWINGTWPVTITGNGVNATGTYTAFGGSIIGTTVTSGGHGYTAGLVTAAPVAVLEAAGPTGDAVAIGQYPYNNAGGTTHICCIGYSPHLFITQNLGPGLWGLNDQLVALSNVPLGNGWWDSSTNLLPVGPKNANAMIVGADGGSIDFRCSGAGFGGCTWRQLNQHATQVILVTDANFVDGHCFDCSWSGEFGFDQAGRGTSGPRIMFGDNFNSPPANKTNLQLTDLDNNVIGNVNVTSGRHQIILAAAILNNLSGYIFLLVDGKVVLRKIGQITGNPVYFVDEVHFFGSFVAASPTYEASFGITAVDIGPFSPVGPTVHIIQ